MANTEKKQSQDLRYTIERWLTEEFDEVQPVPAADGMMWAFSASFSSERKLLVGRRREFKDLIQITSGLRLSDLDRAQFAGLARDKRREFLYETAQKLLTLDVHYQGIADPLQEIWVHSKCYIDGLTRDVFSQRVLRIGNTILILGLALSQLFGEGFSRASSAQDEGIN